MRKFFGLCYLLVFALPAFSQTLTYQGQLGVTLTVSTDDGKFDRPLAAAITNDGTIYVIDRNNERIQYFDSDLNFLGKWGSEGTGNTQFGGNSPDDIAIDGDGNVWIADRVNDRILKFTSTGSFLLQIGTTNTPGTADGDFDNPAAIGYNPINGFIYVGDRNNERIQYFNTSGAFQGKWGSSGSSNGQFASNGGTEDISFDASGNLWVTDRVNQRVQKFSSTGTHLQTIGTTPASSADGRFDQPTGIAVNTTTGQIFVGDRNNERIQIFDPDGTFKEKFGSLGSGNLQFNSNGGIQDMTFNPDNSLLFVSDMNNQRVQILAVQNPAPTSATVAAVVFLEGAYNSTDEDLNASINSIIPDQQPYSFNGHSQTTTGTSIPAGAVDWVLVELREAASADDALDATKVGAAAGFLMENGTIKATDGTSDLTIALSDNTGSEFFVVIYHRNHLPIMSATAISESSGKYSIDFTSDSDNTYKTTTALVSLTGGKFGMPAGDTDGDGDIDATDLSTWRTNNGIVFSYGGNGVADFNLDGVINAVDRNSFHQKNTAKKREVPGS